MMKFIKKEKISFFHARIKKTAKKLRISYPMPSASPPGPKLETTNTTMLSSHGRMGIACDINEPFRSELMCSGSLLPLLPYLYGHSMRGSGSQSIIRILTAPSLSLRLGILSASLHPDSHFSSYSIPYAISHKYHR